MTMKLATGAHTQDKNQAVIVWEESRKYRASCEGVKTAARGEKMGVVCKPEQKALRTAG